MNDLRIYKKSVLSIQENTIEEQEDYYLMDGFGKTVEILHRKDDSQGYGESWEYFASGAERECRLVPTSSQAPTANSGNANVKFKKDQVSFFLYDHLGNTRVTYTPTSFISHPGDPTVAVNKVNTVIDYFPYGKVLREFQNGDQERYLTTQHERDSETGLDYRGARYYDNEVGRFLSLDPLAAEFASWSAYNYVMGNPLIFTDPSGREPENADGSENSETKQTGWTENHLLLNQTFGDPSGFNDVIMVGIVSQKGLNFIKSWEKFKGEIYDDNGDKAGGTLTIGYGHALKKGEQQKYKGGITEKAATKLLKSDMRIAEKLIINNVTTELNQHQYDALVSYVFNTNSLRGTKLIYYLNKGDFKSAVKEMDINSQEGEFVQGLENRRVDERNMFTNGIYKMHN